MIFTFDQVIILITDIPAMYFAQDKNEKLKRWSPIMGLIGQPFWLYASYHAQLWGAFILSILYTYCWYQSYRNLWKR